jgi:urease accessory protein
VDRQCESDLNWYRHKNEFAKENIMILLRRLLILIAMLAVAPLAYAHPGHDHGQGLLAGVLHPLTGIDHILFMLGVGLLIALRAPALGTRVVTLMLAAQVLAVVVMRLPVAPQLWEIAIALSLMAIGLLLWRRQVSVITQVTAVLGAGLHAAAHWSGMPVGAPVVAYGLGVAMASALLYGIGYLSGRALRPYAERVAQVFGVSLAGGGLWMLWLG